jgi:hypothetical protein
MEIYISLVHNPEYMNVIHVQVFELRTIEA